MKKGIIALSIIAAMAITSTASAEEMMRYEREYYQSGKKEIPFEAKRKNREASEHKVSTERRDRGEHPIFADQGRMRDL